ncbi:hypothetical protein D3C72_1595380 [compost metagenome]
MRSAHPAVGHEAMARALRLPVAGAPAVAAASADPVAGHPDLAAARGGLRLIARRRRRMAVAVGYGRGMGFGRRDESEGAARGEDGCSKHELAFHGIGSLWAVVIRQSGNQAIDHRSGDPSNDQYRS